MVTDKEITVEEFKASQKSDTSWKKKPWIDPKDGYEYRMNRVLNKDGSYTVFKVRIGKKPLMQPKGE